MVTYFDAMALYKVEKFKRLFFIDVGMDPDYVVLLNPETKVKILHVVNSIFKNSNFWNSQGSYPNFWRKFYS